jgi:mono/diheme cytochrome c family protein
VTSAPAVRRRSAAVIALLAVAAAFAACDKAEYERPPRDAQVSQADSLLTVETFDSIAWTSDAERAQAGNNVYAAKCRSCHGYLGAGDTNYAREHNLDVPSIVRPDWPYQNVASVRRIIYIGHPEGMPTWGVAGITPREIDAVAHYLVEVLRPEVLGR